jgi:hypothetical protein
MQLLRTVGNMAEKCRGRFLNTCNETTWNMENKWEDNIKRVVYVMISDNICYISQLG